MEIIVIENLTLFQQKCLKYFWMFFYLIYWVQGLGSPSPLFSALKINISKDKIF